MTGVKDTMKTLNRMIYTRRSIVEFEVNDEKKYGINVQNDMGNKYAPTIIVAEIDIIKLNEPTITTDYIVMETYPDEGVMMVVFPSLIRTIDKDRVTNCLGKYPELLFKQVEKTIDDLFSFTNSYQVIMADVGQVVGSEQGGYRPILVLEAIDKGEEVQYIGIAMTSKIGKTKLPTHVFFQEGEAELARDSNMLAEQLVQVIVSKEEIENSKNSLKQKRKKEDLFVELGFIPNQKLSNAKYALDVSVGLKEVPRKEPIGKKIIS